MSRFYLVLCAGLMALCCFATAHADSDNPRVLIETNFGNILVELFPEDAPITVGNFLDYADSGFYEDTIFHRVEPNFVIQGGGVYRRS